MNKHIFLSHPLSSETIGYGGKTGLKINIINSISNNSSCNESEWVIRNHLGTHIDAPYHFSNDGSTLDKYEASDWVFNNTYMHTIDTKEEEIIPVGDWTELIPSDADLLILKTNFEKYRDTEKYWKQNPGLSPELGSWLRSNRPNIRAIGFDFISISSYQHRPLGKEAHKSFLTPDSKTKPILIVEDMSLKNLDHNPKQVIISPLIIKDADGSPVTIIATL